MALRLVHELIMKLTQDTAGKRILFERQTSDSRITLDTWFKHNSGTFTVTDGTQENLALGDVTSPVRGVYIEVDADCDIRLSGSSDPIQVRRLAAQAAFPSKIFLEANITAIEVDASQGADVNGTYLVWGDEA